MELFRSQEVPPPSYQGESAGLLYQPPTVSYSATQPMQYGPQVSLTSPPGYGLQPPPYLPPGMGPTVPPGVQGPPTIEVAKGYKWKESAPVVVYLALVIAGLFLIIFTPSTAKAKLVHMLIAVVWTLLWGFFVIWASRKGKVALAWVLALVPIVIWLIIQILIFIKAVVINV